MDLTHTNITVIGAGIGGLAAALALHRRGANVTVLEQAAEIAEVGAGLQISPNGLAVLRALDLETDLAAKAVQAQAVVLKDYRRPKTVVRLDLARLAADQRYYMVLRSDLINLLAAAVRRTGIRVRLLQRVASVNAATTQSPKPRMTMENGHCQCADLVIGADGLHSRVRPVLNGQDTAFFTGQVAWRALIPNEIGLPNEARVYMGPNRHLVSYPVDCGRQINLVAVQERAAWTDEGWHHADDPMAVRDAFWDFAGEAREMLARVRTVHLWGLFRHPVAVTWQGDGLALLGDAAHPTLPFLAQGANMALEDAWVLADSLATATNMAEGLSRYQTRRYDRVKKVISAAQNNAWKYHLSFGPVRAAAHLALNLGGRVAPGAMVHQFDWLYGHDVTA